MGRKWIEEPDETEEISLEDTQEYRVDEVPETDDEFIEADPEEEFEEDFFDDFPEDDFEEDFEPDDADSDGPEPPRKQFSDLLRPLKARFVAIWAAFAAQARGVDLPKLPWLRPGEPEPSERSDPGKTGEIPTDSDADPDDGARATADEEAGAGTGMAGVRRFASGNFLPIIGIVLASLAVGFGSYAITRGSGDDVDAARLEGEAAGREAGAIEGASRGYPAGFTRGREAGFLKAYERAYRINYKRAFEQAGLDVPADKDIDVPEP